MKATDAIERSADANPCAIEGVCRRDGCQLRSGGGTTRFCSKLRSRQAMLAWRLLLHLLLFVLLSHLRATCSICCFACQVNSSWRNKRGRRRITMCTWHASTRRIAVVTRRLGLDTGLLVHKGHGAMLGLAIVARRAPTAGVACSPDDIVTLDISYSPQSFGWRSTCDRGFYAHAHGVAGGGIREGLQVVTRARRRRRGVSL